MRALVAHAQIHSNAQSAVVCVCRSASSLFAVLLLLKDGLMESKAAAASTQKTPHRHLHNKKREKGRKVRHTEHHHVLRMQNAVAGTRARTQADTRTHARNVVQLGDMRPRRKRMVSRAPSACSYIHIAYSIYCTSTMPSTRTGCSIRELGRVAPRQQRMLCLCIHNIVYKRMACVSTL